MKNKCKRLPSLILIIIFSMGSIILTGAQKNLPLKKKPEIALFFCDNFPTVDAPEIPFKNLSKALDGIPYHRLSSPEDFKALNPHRFNLLILPYGSAFPLPAWQSIFNFLNQGGSLLVLGGAPFHQPVLWDKAGKKWVLGVRQPTYAHELLIGPAEALLIASGGHGALFEKTAPCTPTKTFIYTKQSDSIWGEESIKEHLQDIKTVYALTVRFATTKEFPDEDGSYGPYLAVMRPLIQLVDKEGIPRCAPIVEIDRLLGSSSGGRWLFAANDGRLSPSLIRACIKRAARGAVSLQAFPVHASVAPDEIPKISILLRRPGINNYNIPISARIVIKNDKNEEIFAKKITMAGEAPSWKTGVEITPAAALKPGLYKSLIFLPDVNFQPCAVETGFWVEDKKLLHSGPKLTVSRDWLRKDGRVFPIIGTTYMDRESHRKFLLYPNPALWDEDFRDMRLTGINFIRTGIWTGWRELVTDRGNIKESVLRALNAFIHTAAKHEIMINFTFFAFLPPAFGGSNPYLDPKSLQGQQDFIRQIASSYRGVNWIHFDLINEPSYAPPEALWQTRPIADEYEKKAWQEWLVKRHGPDPDMIRNRWQAAAVDPFSLPRAGDFSYTRLKEKHLPARAMDFILFSQDIFCRWAKTLRETVKKAAGDVLVTVGQDEGGTVKRPGQQFFAPYVDYTSMHTWWFNDNLLWDGIVSRVPEKPNLISETGMMRLEDIKGMPWRSPEQAAALLERKFAFAFAARAAGAVQWIWNINPYQPLDNEAVIGSFRVDGTAKPELQVLKNFASFFKKAAPYLDDFEPEAVFLILPLSRLYSGQQMGIEATQKMVRVLADHFDIFPTAISEYTLTYEKIREARLLILPVPEMLDDKAAAVLLKAAEKGIKVLITGPLIGNPYGEISASLKNLGARYPCPPLSLYEPTDNKTGFVTFGRGITQFLRKGTHRSFSFADSNIRYEPLPLELAGNPAPLLALLKKVLAAAGVNYEFSETPLPCRLLYAPRAVLGICVNETSQKLEKTINFKNKKLRIEVEPGRARLFLLRRSTGELLFITDSHQGGFFVKPPP